MKRNLQRQPEPIRIKRRLFAVKTFKIFSIETSLDAVSCLLASSTLRPQLAIGEARRK